MMSPYFALAFLLVSLPIFYPLVTQMGYDPIWFGQIITIVTTMGSIMPPIGICCYVLGGHGQGHSSERCLQKKHVMYYILSYIIAIILLILSPYWTVLVLSNLVR